MTLTAIHQALARTPAGSAPGRAAQFLATAAGPDGLWKDFSTLAGSSLDWVSGFVLDRLGAAGGAAGQELARSAVALTRRQRPNGGWAYNQRVPTDADSTAWVLSALAGTAGWRPSTVLRGVRYLVRHQCPDGGFATYQGDDQIERYLGVAPELVVGWQGSHVSVTAAAACALLGLGAAPSSNRVLEAVRYLRRSRDPDGLWRCYWWRGEAYPTWAVTWALLRARALTASERHEIADRAVDRQLTDGGWPEQPGEPSDPWATACWLQTVRAVGVPGARIEAAWAAGADLLSRTQRPDGSWTAGPILRIPVPMARTPRPAGQWRVDGLGTGVLVRPHTGCFVTAQATRALQPDPRRLPRDSHSSP